MKVLFCVCCQFFFFSPCCMVFSAEMALTSRVLNKYLYSFLIGQKKGKFFGHQAFVVLILN